MPRTRMNQLSRRLHPEAGPKRQFALIEFQTWDHEEHSKVPASTPEPTPWGYKHYKTYDYNILPFSFW